MLKAKIVVCVNSRDKFEVLAHIKGLKISQQSQAFGIVGGGLLYTCLISYKEAAGKQSCHDSLLP